MLALASPAPAIASTDSSTVSVDHIARFQDEGFVGVANVIPRDEALAFRAAALAIADGPETVAYSNRAVFQQLVNVWRTSEAMRALTFHPALLAAVNRLAGRPMRLWHDHILIKRPRNETPTEFHQDQPYWSIERGTFTISAWIALGDASVESGCMGFIPKTHVRRDLSAQDLNNAGSLIGMWPDLEFAERTIVPLQAGGSTFHQGFCAHRAGANHTDVPRVAFSVIFVERGARFNGAEHCVTQGLGLTTGDQLPDHMCPPI